MYKKLWNIQVLSYRDYSIEDKHYGIATWVGNPTKRKQPYKNTELKEYLMNYKIFALIKNKFSKNSNRVIYFFVYDFLEYGFLHYVKLLKARF